MNYPMRSDLQVGNKFPDFELGDHKNQRKKLSDIIRKFPGVLIFSRGAFCPKDTRQLRNYVTYLQPEFRVNYCKMVTVSVDDRMTTNELRDSIGADWPFLMDPDRKLLYELEMVDKTDPMHGDIYIPYTFILDHDLTIYRIYNGWWYVGRPTVEEIRMDLRSLMSRRTDWTYSGSAESYDD